MIEYEFNPEKMILHIQPKGPLSEVDFKSISETVDPAIEQHGQLNGIIVETPDFPWWDSFSSLMSHFKFVKDHHKHIKKVALVTDTKVATVAEKFGSHFVAAEIKHFPTGKANEAETWIMSA